MYKNPVAGLQDFYGRAPAFPENQEHLRKAKVFLILGLTASLTSAGSPVVKPAKGGDPSLRITAGFP